MKVSRKRVKVLTNGPIRAKGWAYGPILAPYFEDVKTIFAMLRDRIKVVEVLNGGVEIELSAQNFDKDNSHLAFKEIEQPADVIIETPVEVTPAVVEERVVEVEETPIVDITADVAVEEEAVVITKENKPAPHHYEKKKNKNAKQH